MTHQGGSSHIDQFYRTDILASPILQSFKFNRSQNQNYADRDRFILSKGH